MSEPNESDEDVGPNPLSKVHSTAKPLFSPLTLYRHPELAKGIATVLALWAHVEHQYLKLYAAFLETDVRVVNEMLESIKNTDIRRTAIRTAAEHKLSPDEFRLFEAVEGVIKPSRDRRNEYAHHLWGTADELPGCLLLADPAAILRSHSDWTERFRARKPGERPKVIWDRSKIMVYKPGAIEADVGNAKRALQLVIRLGGALHWKDAAQVAELSHQPEIERVLQRPSNEKSRKAQQPGPDEDPLGLSG